jgi:hypothetical protein
MQLAYSVCKGIAVSLRARWKVVCAQKLAAAMGANLVHDEDYQQAYKNQRSEKDEERHGHAVMANAD